MRCGRCGSTNVYVTSVNETQLKDAHHGCFWWMMIGWWWIPVKWICLTIPAILAKLFIPKKQRAVNKRYSVAVCQNCGHSWKL